MESENKTEMELKIPINFNESLTYLQLIDTIKIQLETGDEAYLSIQKFKKFRIKFTKIKYKNTMNGIINISKIFFLSLINFLNIYQVILGEIIVFS
jgi:hypothetical protein